MLSVSNLNFGYGGSRGKKVIDDLTLNFEPGHVYGLLGPNGTGKSTLLYLMIGLLTPLSGDVTYDGFNTRLRKPSVLQDMFLVPEEFELPAIKLSQYVKINSVYYPRFSMEDMTRHLKTFDMTEDLNLGKLSMGQRKKVFMAFALACNTRVILMDEPTNGLDIPGKSAFRRFIAANMTDNRIIVISTHQVRDIDNMLDDIVIINDGKLILATSSSHIMSKLRFIVTNDENVISSSLYCQRGIGGASVVLPNNDNEDTQLDLEMLFQYAMENPQSLINNL